MARIGVNYSRGNAINVYIGILITAMSGLLLTLGAIVESRTPIHSSWLVLLFLVGLFWFGAISVRFFYYDYENGASPNVLKRLDDICKRIEELE